MADTLTPLLLDAKQEYTSRLKDIIGQRFFHYFHGLYESCEDEEYIIEFQEKLRQVPYWSSSQVSVESSEIVNKNPYFENLMAAVIVTYVKVLSSIRLSEVKPNVQLKLPTVDDFIHELYKQMAGLLYASPFVFEEDNVSTQFSSLVDEAIERSIRRLIPFDDILASYLSAPDPTDMGTGTSPSPVANTPISDDESSDDEDEDIEIQTDPNHMSMPVNGDKISSSDDDDDEYPAHQTPIMQSQDQFPIPQQGAAVFTQHATPSPSTFQTPPMTQTMPPPTQQQQPIDTPQQIVQQVQNPVQQLVPGGRDML